MIYHKSLITLKLSVWKIVEKSQVDQYLLPLASVQQFLHCHLNLKGDLK